MAVCQCAQFSASPKLSYERADIRIGRCVIETIDRGISGKEDFSKGLQHFVGADFAGDWNAEEHLNP